VSSNKWPINKISTAKRNCVRTLDKLAKNPYFQKEKLVIDNLIFEVKSIFNFFINKKDDINGVSRSAMV
jgi:hypothetical protein